MLVFALASQFLLHGMLLRMWTPNPMMTSMVNVNSPSVARMDMLLEFCGRCEQVQNDRELTSNFSSIVLIDSILERKVVRSTPLTVF